VTSNSKAALASRVRNLFVEIEGEDHEYYVLKDTIIPDTCNWVFEEPEWEQWHTSEDPSPVLAISGDPGVGKSHIGASVYDKLLNEVQTNADKTLCAAHFYFREQASDLHTFGNAVNIIIIQVVEQNEEICGMVLAEFNKDEVDVDFQDSEDVFRKLLAPVFRKDSKYHLNLMLDGIDELEDFENLITVLEIIQSEELRISVVVTSRPERVKEISDAVPTTSILVNKEKQKLDLRELIWNRLNSLSSLRTFGRYVKQRVADKLEEFSPSKSPLKASDHPY
jgi:DNA polymerase III delta prime subunit